VKQTRPGYAAVLRANVIAVGRKDGNRLFIHGEEFDL
jgi:hypothetical protein